MRATPRERTIVIEHIPQEWLDYYGGTCKTMCGLTLGYGTKAQRASIRDADVRECILCQCADMLKDVRIPDYIQPTLF